MKGNAEQASGAMLKGVLTFCLQDSLSVRGIHLKLTGVQRVIGDANLSKSKAIKQEEVIYETSWEFINFERDPKKSFVLNPGNYEYPFEHIVPGSKHYPSDSY